MTKLLGTLAMSALMVLAPALAGAQDAWENEPAPSTAQPQELPPPPSDQQPPPAQEQPQAYGQPQAYAQPEAPSGSAVPPGQWVYTQQYGWIWMPYSDAYTQAPANGYGTPYAYVYSPAWSCWAWLAAPWVWGIGPWPYFGVYGPAHYAWYGYGWWRYPSHWHYSAPYGGYAGYRNPPRPAPFRPAPATSYRPGYAYRGAVAAPHGGATFARPNGGGTTFARPYGGGAAGGRGFAPHAGGGFAPRAGGGGAAPHAGGGARGGGHASGSGGHGHGR